MTALLQQLTGSVVQIILFSLVPFLWWLVTARKREGFFHWLGLRRVNSKLLGQTFRFALCIAAGFLLLSVALLYLVRDVHTATSAFAGEGLRALPAALVFAVLGTSLPEEILFRGFLLKRLANKFGFAPANLVQCAVFGLIHGVLFFLLVGAFKAVCIILFTAAVGWCMGAVNEKKADGSILPGWAIHACANIFSSVISMLSLI